MSPYAILGSSVGTEEAASLCERLTSWHDAMVAHERRLKTGGASDTCDDDCPHVEARSLWTEAQTTLGDRAGELTFLRSRAAGVSPAREVAAAATLAPSSPDDASRPTRNRSAQPSVRAASAAEHLQVAGKL